MSLHIRRAGPLDAAPLAELLNAIIRRGGTTAMTVELSAAGMAAWMAQSADRSAWHLAEDDGGTMHGFQTIGPHQHLPPEACDIATFVRIGRTGLGIGTQLFEATCAAARALGYTWINATIRADNPGGLAYYQSRGFEDYARKDDVALAGGLVVNQLRKRYEL
ncbi:acetyltransferase, GNAT family [Candidatus Rhodobacter oscarellae]|uniref:Acetyltransferase, GNAT family n=1 Tax=Candidatus Rhodobacter oscarellae TaxID=1675527 RepID=A0A0J9E481_9RHOB|nr:GNAT family N-acetyltransferase [Candidatus Rhodobacter lobularis]KMW57590.1 acetyltransferase, GNAT family [Candidatus Rhodobacter lobularis]